MVPLIWSALIAGAAAAQGWVSYYTLPDGVPAWSEPSPAGLAEMTTFTGRVRATRMDAPSFGSGYVATNVSYVGDAFILNRFIKRYAALASAKDERFEPLEIVLHDSEYPMNDWSTEKLPRPINWRLQIMQGEMGPPPPPPLVSDATKLRVRLEVWISPKLLLSELQIPADMPVRSETTIDDYVRRREQQDQSRRLKLLETRIKEMKAELRTLAAASQPDR